MTRLSAALLVLSSFAGTCIGQLAQGGVPCNLNVQGLSTVKNIYKVDGYTSTTSASSIQQYSNFGGTPTNTITLERMMRWDDATKGDVSDGWFFFKNVDQTSTTAYSRKLLARCVSDKCKAATTAALIPSTSWTEWEGTSDGGATFTKGVKISTTCCVANPPKCDPVKYSTACPTYSFVWCSIGSCCAYSLAFGKCSTYLPNVSATCKAFNLQPTSPAPSVAGQFSEDGTTASLVPAYEGDGNGEVPPTDPVVIALASSTGLLALIVGFLAFTLWKTRRSAAFVSRA
jgi:hypothetical protein